MQKIKSYFSSNEVNSDPGQQAEIVKMIGFAFASWTMVFTVLFFLVPLVFGTLAPKPKLFRLFTMISLPLMIGTGLAGINFKSKSINEVLVRGLLSGFIAASMISMTLLND
jgi:hypothetical protein